MNVNNILSQIISSSDVESFLTSVWGRSVEYFPQSIIENVNGIMDLNSFERMIGTLNRAHEGWLYLAHGGVKQIPPSMVDTDGLLDLKKIRNAFALGETLYLTKADRLSKPLMEMCRSLEMELVDLGLGLREAINAHVFLTPSNSQGFTAHRDEHASFILQLEGEKEWIVYEPAEVELSSLKSLTPGVVAPELLEDMTKHNFQLRAGDVLYMPEWWPHEAQVLDSYSLHVTLRLFPLRWVDLLLKVCKEHSGLYEALPIGLAKQSEKALGPLVSLLASDEFLEALPSVLKGVYRYHTISKSSYPNDSFKQILNVNQLNLETKLVKPWGTNCTIFDKKGEVCIAFPGGVIRGPSIMREAFYYVVNKDHLCPIDLPSTSEGGDYDRLEVARTFVREGLLRIDERAL